MKCALLFSGGKDSTYAGFLARKAGYEISCLITILSENLDSFMFHTPSITLTKKQAETMEIPIIIQKTKGIKEDELKELESVIKTAKTKYGVEGIVTGAIASVYQASRIQKLCNKLNLECFNPLWQKNPFELLEELIKNGFKVIIVGVGAEGLDESWLGREIDINMINDLNELNKKYGINPAGEGGEFESFVLDCPMFKKPLKLKNKRIAGNKNSWRMEIELN
ncbi:diphthine--ammonia ligase [Candidatus Pacearchaeota archaeon]|nr:diphthine--ammonia ligase [Candidatus Pacearchaeota archaeon]